jgi:Zn-dependent protease with chaperone function
MVVLTVVLSHVMLIWLVWQQGRRAARLMHQREIDPFFISFRIDRLMAMARWATIALAALQLWGLRYGALVNSWFDPQWETLADLLLMMPACVSWLFFWAAQYPVEAGMRQRALAYRMAMQLPAHEMPGRGAYVAQQARHNFYLLVPVILSLAVDQALAAGARRWPWLDYLALPSVLLILVALPWLMTRMWRTQPLTGALRTRLVALARAHRVRFCDVLVWRTHHLIQNAALLGYLPFARYFLMSDALLESLTDRQIEAVFAHEVGHGRHGHVWWYVAFVFGVGLLAAGGVQLAADAANRQLWLTPDVIDQIGSVVTMALMGAGLLWGFTAVSRRFEHQADWFAAQHMARSLEAEPERLTPLTLEEYVTQQQAWVGAGLPVPGGAEAALPAGERMKPTALSGPSITPPTVLPALSRDMPGPAGLRAGAELFGSALTQIITLAHRSMERGGWMHPSGTERIALLRELAVSPARQARFQRQMRRTRWLIVGILAAGVLLTVLTNSHELRSMLL